jgi:hypothetical protein
MDSSDKKLRIKETPAIKSGYTPSADHKKRVSNWIQSAVTQTKAIAGMRNIPKMTHAEIKGLLIIRTSQSELNSDISREARMSLRKFLDDIIPKDNDLKLFTIFERIAAEAHEGDEMNFLAAKFINTIKDEFDVPSDFFSSD